MASTPGVIAFAAGAVLGVAIAEGAKRHHMSVSQFVRAALVGKIPLDLTEEALAQADEEFREMTQRARSGAGRPRKSDRKPDPVDGEG